MSREEHNQQYVTNLIRGYLEAALEALDNDPEQFNALTFTRTNACHEGNEPRWSLSLWREPK